MLSRMFLNEKKSIPKKKVRPLAFDSASEKRAETKKRPLAFDSEKRAGSEKRAKTKKAMITMASNGKTNKVEDLVGSVHESDFAHWMRHGDEPSSSTCGRCTFLRNKAEFRREYPWLTPRPTFMGGHWRLGCDVCSWRCKNSEREKHKREARVQSAGFDICSLQLSVQCRRSPLTYKSPGS